MEHVSPTDSAKVMTSIKSPHSFAHYVKTVAERDLLNLYLFNGLTEYMFIFGATLENAVLSSLIRLASYVVLLLARFVKRFIK